MKNFIFLFGILFCLSANCQDTIIVYDFATQDTSMILPVTFNGNITSDHSSHSFGTMGGVLNLPQTPPTTNLFTGSNFSDLAKAGSLFNVTSFPARTCVRVSQYVNTSHYKYTGMTVGPCFILISANTIIRFPNLGYLPIDSIRVFPAFDNGHPQPGMPTGKVKRIYAFKSFLYGTGGWDDVALLELDNSIGYSTGWAGIGFNSNSNFLSGKVFHKFSYPSGPKYSDSSKVYNGDTLYYNYGNIDALSGGGYGINSNDAESISGQSGSTFLYTDNFMEYYSVALCSFVANYRHSVITNKSYYQLLNVLTTQACPSPPTGLNYFSAEQKTLKLFPNPSINSTTLEFEYDPSKIYDLKIVNIIGQEIDTVKVESGSVNITTAELPAGVYFLHLQSDKKISSVCRMLVEH